MPPALCNQDHAANNGLSAHFTSLTNSLRPLNHRHSRLWNNPYVPVETLFKDPPRYLIRLACPAKFLEDLFPTEATK